MCELAPPIFIGMKICDTSKKKLSKQPPLPAISESDSLLNQTQIEVAFSEPDSPPSEVYVDSPEAIASLNMHLADISETP